MKTNDGSQMVTNLLIGLGYVPEHVTQAVKILSGEVDLNRRPLLTTQQLCRLLGVSRSTLWRMGLPCIVAGKRKRYALDAVMATLANNNNGD